MSPSFGRAENVFGKSLCVTVCVNDNATFSQMLTRCARSVLVCVWLSLQDYFCCKEIDLNRCQWQA